MNKMKISSIGQFIFLALIIVVTIITFVNNHNSVSATPLNVTFAGEYRINNGQWHKITTESRIPALQGDITLKGVFEANTPDGEYIGSLEKGLIILFNLDHISGEIYIGDECVHVFDSENPEIKMDDNIKKLVAENCSPNGAITENLHTDNMLYDMCNEVLEHITNTNAACMLMPKNRVL